MPAKPKPSDTPDESRNDVETEQGFGTGLRAQLQRRRESDSQVTAEIDGHKVEAPLVPVDLYASPSPAAAEA
nr:hypothetical protein [Actinomycetota bacterium]